MPRKIEASTQPVPQPAQPGVTLSELCAEAAQHVAKARVALFDESADAERALAHLDEAIFCLKCLLVQGRKTGPNGAAKLHSV